MTSRYFLVIVILFTIVILISCAGTNKTSAIDESNRKSSYKRVKLSLKNGQKIKEKNAILQSDSANLFLENDHARRSYTLAEIESIKYSNSHIGHYCAIIGGAVGFYIPLRNGRYTIRESSGNSGGILFGGTERRDNMGLAVLSSFVGIVAGYFIGSRFYVKWNDYELNGAEASDLGILTYPIDNNFQVGYKVPID